MLTIAAICLVNKAGHSISESQWVLGNTKFRQLIKNEDTGTGTENFLIFQPFKPCIYHASNSIRIQSGDISRQSKKTRRTRRRRKLHSPTRTILRSGTQLPTRILLVIWPADILDTSISSPAEATKYPASNTPFVCYGCGRIMNTSRQTTPSTGRRRRHRPRMSAGTFRYDILLENPRRT